MQSLFPDDRVVVLTGAENFREVGGYPTEDGRRLCRGLIWRSAHLDALTPEDADILNTLNIRLIADLRRAGERGESASGKIWPGEDVRVASWEDVSAAAPAALGPLQDGHGDGELYRAAIHRYYELMVEAHVHRLRDLYCAIADGEVPVLIHCAAGKDRTGFAVALLLKLLDVKHEYVLADYAVSETLIDWERAAKLGTLGALHPTAHALLNRSDVLYLQTVLDRIAHSHGTIAAFAKAQLGFSESTIEALRTRLLES